MVRAKDIRMPDNIKYNLTAEALGGVYSVLTCVDGTVFVDGNGGALVLLSNSPYVVSVSGEGDTSSAYLVTVNPHDIAEAMEADADEVAGWTTGWEC